MNVPFYLCLAGRFGGCSWLLVEPLQANGTGVVTLVLYNGVGLEFRAGKVSGGVDLLFQARWIPAS